MVRTGLQYIKITLEFKKQKIIDEISKEKQELRYEPLLKVKISEFSSKSSYTVFVYENVSLEIQYILCG